MRPTATQQMLTMGSPARSHSVLMSRRSRTSMSSGSVKMSMVSKPSSFVMRMPKAVSRPDWAHAELIRPSFMRHLPGGPAVLVAESSAPYHTEIVRSVCRSERVPMSIDKSLRRRNQLARARSVLTRAERIKTLKDQERWEDGRSPFGLPKVKVVKVVLKKAKKAKEEEK